MEFKENLGGVGHVLDLDCGGGHIGVCICKDILNGCIYCI